MQNFSQIGYQKLKIISYNQEKNPAIFTYQGASLWNDKNLILQNQACMFYILPI